MHHHHGQANTHEHPDPGGGVIHWAHRYDLLVPVLLAGRGRRLRTQIGQILGLRPGHNVLDVGCGTGTLALNMTKTVGVSGSVTGIDASPEMITTATAKAARRHLPTRFQIATAQQLPLPDNSMDAVVTSLALHHLPASDRPQAVREMFRVLRPSGHLVIVEFRSPDHRVGKGLVSRTFGRAMADTDLASVIDLTAVAGGIDVEQSAAPIPWLGIVHARKP